MLLSILIPPSKISDQKSAVIICQNQAVSLFHRIQLLQTIHDHVQSLTLERACTEEGHSFLLPLFGGIDLSF